MAHDLPREIERKYLLTFPEQAAMAAMEEASCTEIFQYYLKDDGSGYSRRIRKRGTPGTGWQYTYTRKKPVAFGERIELEDEITAAQFQVLMQERLPGVDICKRRCCFTYRGQRFELDIYDLSDAYATLEIELPDMQTPVTLPPFLPVIREITGENAYGNFELAHTKCFPEER